MPGVPVSSLAMLTSQCPALVVPAGVGCAGSAGVGVLDADQPWIGSRWGLRGDALPSPAFVFVAHGEAPASAPLASLLPEGQPGCHLLLQPTLVDAVYTDTGTAAIAYDLPNDPTLVGVTFRSQMLPFAVDTNGAWLSVTSTNALAMTVGAF